MFEKKSPFWRGLRTENGILHLDAAGNDAYNIDL